MKIVGGFSTFLWPDKTRSAKPVQLARGERLGVVASSHVSQCVND
jgi:hypothetical protein